MIEREQLVRLMGLWGYDLDFKLPGALPALPGKPRTLPAIEQDAMDHRVDLQIARIEVEALARSYGLTRATHFINVLDAIWHLQDAKGQRQWRAPQRWRGVRCDFHVPIFDFGRPRVREAEQHYMQAVNLLAEAGGQCPLGGERSLPDLSIDLRYCWPLSARGAAVAADHLRPGATTVQRHAY